jgi:site-specific DNA-methyltransferase (adenine-specific)
MLKNKKIAQIHDFPETSDCFPGLNIRGGVCYFLLDKEHNKDCKIFNYKNGEVISSSVRPLLEPKSHVFIRYNEAIQIYRKVKAFGEKTIDESVSAQKPFGFRSNFSEFKKERTANYNITLYRFGDNGFVSDDQILKNKHWIKVTKVIVSKASPGGDTYPHQIISKPIIAEPMSCCTETYLVVGIYRNRILAENMVTYMQTRFFRFMMSLIKNTQNIARGVFAFVPTQDFSVSWTDEKLFKKYGITEKEIEFIDSLIRPMDLTNYDKVNE